MYYVTQVPLETTLRHTLNPYYQVQFLVGATGTIVEVNKIKVYRLKNPEKPIPALGIVSLLDKFLAELLVEKVHHVYAYVATFSEKSLVSR